jgi:hypothetical protein
MFLDFEWDGWRLCIATTTFAPGDAIEISYPRIPCIAPDQTDNVLGWYSLSEEGYFAIVGQEKVSSCRESRKASPPNAEHLDISHLSPCTTPSRTTLTL